MTAGAGPRWPERAWGVLGPSGDTDRPQSLVEPSIVLWVWSLSRETLLTDTEILIPRSFSGLQNISLDFLCPPRI